MDNSRRCLPNIYNSPNPIKNMKKKQIITNKTANKLVVALYFLSSLLYLNVLPTTLGTHAVGIALLIAGTYSTVVIMKGQKLLF